MAVRKSIRWIGFSEIAQLLGCSRATVRKRVLDKTIPGAATFLRRLRVDRVKFEKWLKTQPVSHN